MAGCPNCQTQLVGRFCHQCGQEQGPLLPSLRRWAGDLVDELLLVNGRLPRTVRLLLAQPGTLTRDWAEGRRARHVAPIRLFLGSAVLFFFAWHLSAERQGLYLAETFHGAIDGWYAGSDLTAPADTAAIAGTLAGRIVSGLRILLLVVSVPLVAVLNYSGWKDRSGAMVVQLTFSLHLHAVGLTVLAAWLSAGRVVPALLGPNAILIPFGAMVVYLIVALRRAFALPVRAAVARGLGLAIAYWFLAGLLALVYALLPVWPVLGSS